MNGEEFLQSLDIWHHPAVSDRLSRQVYEVSDLLDMFLKHHTEQKLNIHSVVRSAGEITDRMKANVDEIKKWREDVKKELAKHIEIRDVGYVDHCRERIVDAQAENNALRWVLGIE